MRHLPQKENQKQGADFQVQRAPHRGPADHRRQSTRNSPNQGVQGRDPLERRVDKNVTGKGQRRQDRCQRLRKGEAQVKNAADPGGSSKAKDLGRLQTPGGERPIFRAPHERVIIALQELVACARTRGNKGRTDQRMQENAPWERAAAGRQDCARRHRQ